MKSRKKWKSNATVVGTKMRGNRYVHTKTQVWLKISSTCANRDNFVLSGCWLEQKRKTTVFSWMHRFAGKHAIVRSGKVRSGSRGWCFSRSCSGGRNQYRLEQGDDLWNQRPAKQQVNHSTCRFAKVKSVGAHRNERATQQSQQNHNPGFFFVGFGQVSLITEPEF